ncbi:MAG: hypothetical protein M3Y21_12025, partial [Candidatus Eremiobacteraeota bacterium]|nr:hypothetical protein [Candidatus Eremiobacteraeota bacterium]
MKPRFVAALAAILFLGSLTVVSAQSAPAPTPAPTTTPTSPYPSIPGNTTTIIRDVIDSVVNGIVKPSYGWSPDRAHGSVTFYRRFDMQVRMQLNKYRDVHLHQGTVINPRGWSIQPGQTV